MLQLRKKRVINSSQVNGDTSVDTEYNLDHIQNSIFLHIMQLLNTREEYYSFYCESASDSDSEGNGCNFDNVNTVGIRSQSTNLTREWRKFILIIGRHGTGKSQILSKTIETCIEDQRAVLVTTPTGILAARYQNIFSGSIATDTVHSAFKYPVNLEEQSPTVNWNIATYDCLIIDEISMVRKQIFDHIIYTLQQIPKPIETVDGKVMQVERILTDKAFLSIVEKFKLTHQYRVFDDEYEKFLNCIRLCKPTQDYLDSIQNGHIICTNSEPTDEEIYNVVRDNPDSTVLTISRRATATVNNAVMTRLFKDKQPLGYIQCDYEMEVIPIYKHMRVMVTRNIDKINSVVNGAEGNVRYMENQRIFVELVMKRIVPLS